MTTTPDTLRLDTNVERGRPMEILVDGEPVQTFEGETIAAALVAAGRMAFRHAGPDGQPRGIFCGMGICYDCLVDVAGQGHVRACMTVVEPGMQVTTLRA